jgi:hypothetical protein
MKPKKIQSKLKLTKTTIADLNHEAMGNVQGGASRPLCIFTITCTQNPPDCQTDQPTCPTCYHTCGHYYCGPVEEEPIEPVGMKA